jgi:hypothetical protein
MYTIVIGNSLIYFIASIEFSVDGVPFRIIASDSTGPGYHAVEHTVKNLSNGNCTTYSMEQLIAIFQKYNLVSKYQKP